ncbi:MAG: general secretion pathway protein H [Enterobacterales bacterium]|jgi:general secretion pathway protein H
MSAYPSFAQRKSTGFSLLELIIVLVIIGVLVAAVTLSISDGRGDKLRLEARRLAARISLARDEAILTNQEFGLEITEEGYQFLVLKDDRWEIVESFGERQLVQQKLPENMLIQLEVEGLYAQFQNQLNVNRLFKDYDDNDTSDSDSSDTNSLLEDAPTDSNEPIESNEDAALAKKIRPQIYLMTSGEINPFILLIGYDDNEPIYYQLTASIEGQVSFEGPIREPFTFAEIKIP